jgi:MSHA biogenesis protein MshO
MRRRSHRHSGVTLIEMAITIGLVAILAGMVIFFGSPVKSYTDSSRRAALADAADGALRRIGRDLRLALPNSVRISGDSLEFLLVRAGGRYRSEADAAATNTCDDGSSAVPENDVLSFGGADTCFKTLGDVANIDEVVDNSDFLVVYNLVPGTANADAYETDENTGGNKSKITSKEAGAGSERLVFESNTFTHESPGRRFFVIEGPVSYACDLGAGELRRYSGYLIKNTQPIPGTFSGGINQLLVSGVTGCSFSYDAAASSQGAGLVTLRLQLRAQTSGGSETVTLYHAVHVNNIP